LSLALRHALASRKPSKVTVEPSAMQLRSSRWIRLYLREDGRRGQWAREREKGFRC
jgi:hypothetical protein